MAEKEGYVKAFRKLMNWRWYTVDNTFRIFMHCLLSANWKDGEINGKVIPKGSFLTSYDKLAEQTGLTKKEVRNAIANLKKTGEIMHEKFLNASLVTVVNYEMYQEEADLNDEIKGTQRAHEGHTKGTRRAPNEEYKKNIYNAQTTSFDAKMMFKEFWDLYPRKVSKKKSEETFLKKIKDEETYERLMNGLKAAVNEWKTEKTQQKFIPHASTWLNQERWKDEALNASEESVQTHEEGYVIL